MLKFKANASLQNTHQSTATKKQMLHPPNPLNFKNSLKQSKIYNLNLTPENPTGTIRTDGKTEDVVNEEAATTITEANIKKIAAPTPDYIAGHMAHLLTLVLTENHQPKTTKPTQP